MDLCPPFKRFHELGDDCQAHLPPTENICDLSVAASAHGNSLRVV